MTPRRVKRVRAVKDAMAANAPRAGSAFRAPANGAAGITGADVDDAEGGDRLAPLLEGVRVREGGDVGRASSPAWDLTTLRIRREDKARFDLLRVSRSWDGRVRPHWEVFSELLDGAENT